MPQTRWVRTRSSRSVQRHRPDGRPRHRRRPSPAGSSRSGSAPRRPGPDSRPPASRCAGRVELLARAPAPCLPTSRCSVYPPTSSSSRRTRNGGDLAAEFGPQAADLVLERLGERRAAGGRRVVGRGLRAASSQVVQAVAAGSPGSARPARRVCSASAVGVDRQPLRLGHVDHVQRHDDRHAQFQELRRQVQVAVEVGRIDDGQDHVRPRLLRPAAEEQIDGHHLVGAARGEAVGAGQVDQLERRSPPWANRALLHLDGDAGVVADVLAQPGQGVEQGRLAGVRVADQGDGERLAAGMAGRRGGSERGGRRRPAASRLRRLRRVSPRRTSIGSPSGAKPSTSTVSPFEQAHLVEPLDQGRVAGERFDLGRAARAEVGRGSASSGGAPGGRGSASTRRRAGRACSRPPGAGTANPAGAPGAGSPAGCRVRPGGRPRPARR